MGDTPAEVAFDIITLVGYGLLGIILGLLASVALGGLIRVVVRKRRNRKAIRKRLRTPLRVFLATVGLDIGILLATGWPSSAPPPEWRTAFQHVMVIVLIMCGAYVITGVIGSIQDSVLSAHRDAVEDVHAKRIRTQTRVLARVAIALVWVIAISSALLTFEQFRAIGASLIASAGVLSIIAGLAAQGTLANVFAGIQLAFTDALRVGDLVVVDGNMGTIHDITLTYVVISSWDGRKWIVPSTVLITKMFETWTYQNPQVFGTVEFDLDWMVPIDAMRVELQRVVRATSLWDRRRADMQVLETTSGYVKVRCVVSAASPSQLWDLRCLVREKMVLWLQDQAPYALPRTRLEPETTPAPSHEERQGFIAAAQQELDEQLSNDATQQISAAPRLSDDTGEETIHPSAGRNWLKALRDRRQASKQVRDHQHPPPPRIEDLMASVFREGSGQPGRDVPDATGMWVAKGTDEPEAEVEKTKIDPDAGQADARPPIPPKKKRTFVNPASKDQPGALPTVPPGLTRKRSEAEAPTDRPHQTPATSSDPAHEVGDSSDGDSGGDSEST